MPPEEELAKLISEAKSGENLKKILNPHLEFGSSLIDHVLVKSGFAPNVKINKGFDPVQDLPKLMQALREADEMMESAKNGASKGYIIQKKESKSSQNGSEFILTNIEFHPFLFEQFKDQLFAEYETFDFAVDEYFSSMEGQKLDLKALQQERDALKKLDNVRKDHSQRLVSLLETQKEDRKRAELITRNQSLVDSAILAIQNALASQISWPDIQELVKQAQAKGDPVAGAIRQLKLDKNHMSILLSDPYADNDDVDEKEDDEEENIEEMSLKPMVVDIDLGLTAFKNARQYYDMKRTAAKKQQKTIESQSKAFKSAERKTKQTLKEAQVIHSINKARKVYWFEKFYWFITSENYLGELT